MKAPIEWPTSGIGPPLSATSDSATGTRSAWWARSPVDGGRSRDPPRPRRSTATRVHSSGRASPTVAQDWPDPVMPCTASAGRGPAPNRSEWSVPEDVTGW